MSKESAPKRSKHWLLLLPLIPSELSLNAIKVAFEPGLTVALHDASEWSYQNRRNIILEVGAAYSNYADASYSYVQSVLALLYELSSVICVREKIDIIYNNDVDVRFFLFCYPPDALSQQHDMLEANRKGSHFPQLPLLAQSKREWSNILSIHSDTGEDILQQFLKARRECRGADTGPSISRLPGGTAVIRADASKTSLGLMGTQAIGGHQSVAVGGTFDHLHAGHKLLLTMTLLCCCIPQEAAQGQCPVLTAGITGDELLKNKKYKELVEDWPQRAHSVRLFLHDTMSLLRPHFDTRELRHLESGGAPLRREENFDGLLTLRCVEIFDPFGPTVTDKTISALVISAETRSGGEAINQRRKEERWPELEVFEVGVLGTTGPESGGDPTNFEHKLSSTEIRSRIHLKAARNE